MAESIQVPAAGGIPPLPPGASQGLGVANHGTQPTASVPSAPTFTTNPVPPASGASFTEEQVQARINAALAEKMQPAAQVPANVPAPSFDFGTDTRDDPLLDSMSSLFNSAAAAGGVDIERALGHAVSHGNTALIDEAYIREKGGANAPHLIQVARSIVDHVTRTSTAAKTAAFEVAGGEAQWNAAAAAFNAGAPEHVKVVVGKMLESGNVGSIQAAAKMILDHAGQTGLVPKPGALLTPTQGGGAAGSALSAQDFQTAHFKLDRHAPTFQRDRADLMNRRALGKRLGL